MRMRLVVRAKQTRVSQRTAWRMWEAGTLPVPAEQPILGVYGKRPAANRAKKAMEALNG